MKAVWRNYDGPDRSIYWSDEAHDYASKLGVVQRAAGGSYMVTVNNQRLERKYRNLDEAKKVVEVIVRMGV